MTAAGTSWLRRVYSSTREEAGPALSTSVSYPLIKFHYNLYNDFVEWLRRSSLGPVRREESVKCVCAITFCVDKVTPASSVSKAYIRVLDNLYIVAHCTT